MPFQTRITRYPGHVHVLVAGSTSIRHFVELVSSVGEETVYWSDRRVVIDLRGVEGSLSTDEQIFLGELVAQNLSHLERLASIVPQAQLTRNSERAAQKLGTQLRVFDDEAQAVAWAAADMATEPAASALRAG